MFPEGWGSQISRLSTHECSKVGLNNHWIYFPFTYTETITVIVNSAICTKYLIEHPRTRYQDLITSNDYSVRPFEFCIRLLLTFTSQLFYFRFNMETEGERINIKFKYYIDEWNFWMDAAFNKRETQEHETAWLLHITEYLDLHHHYTNNCTTIRYNDIQICDKRPTCFGIFRPYLVSYSTKKSTLITYYTFLKTAEKDRNF